MEGEVQILHLLLNRDEEFHWQKETVPLLSQQSCRSSGETFDAHQPVLLTSSDESPKPDWTSSWWGKKTNPISYEIQNQRRQASYNQSNAADAQSNGKETLAARSWRRFGRMTFALLNSERIRTEDRIWRTDRQAMRMTSSVTWGPWVSNLVVFVPRRQEEEQEAWTSWGPPLEAFGTATWASGSHKTRTRSPGCRRSTSTMGWRTRGTHYRTRQDLQGSRSEGTLRIPCVSLSAPPGSHHRRKRRTSLSLSLSLSPQRLDSLASLSSSRLPVPQSELSEFLRQCLRSCSLRAHLFSRQTKGRRRECMSISKTPTWSQIIRIELSGKRRRLSEGGDSRNSFMVGGTTSFFKEQHNFTWQQYLDDEEDEFLLTAFVRLSAPVSGS